MIFSDRFLAISSLTPIGVIDAKSLFGSVRLLKVTEFRE
jgi:hypothetical protein